MKNFTLAFFLFLLLAATGCKKDNTNTGPGSGSGTPGRYTCSHQSVANYDENGLLQDSAQSYFTGKRLDSTVTFEFVNGQFSYRYLSSRRVYTSATQYWETYYTPDDSTQKVLWLTNTDGYVTELHTYDKFGVSPITYDHINYHCPATGSLLNCMQSSDSSFDVSGNILGTTVSFYTGDQPDSTEYTFYYNNAVQFRNNGIYQYISANQFWLTIYGSDGNINERGKCTTDEHGNSIVIQQYSSTGNTMEGGTYYTFYCPQ